MIYCLTKAIPFIHTCSLSYATTARRYRCPAAGVWCKRVAIPRLLYFKHSIAHFRVFIHTTPLWLPAWAMVAHQRDLMSPYTSLLKDHAPGVQSWIDASGFLKSDNIKNRRLRQLALEAYDDGCTPARFSVSACPPPDCIETISISHKRTPIPNRGWRSLFMQGIAALHRRVAQAKRSTAVAWLASGLRGIPCAFGRASANRQSVKCTHNTAKHPSADRRRL